MEMWTIYDHPRDYPDHFIARLSIIESAGARITNNIILGDTLEEVREKLPPGLVCLTRSPDDPAVIVEVWL